MPRIELTFDLKGNLVSDKEGRGMEIFEKGRLILVISELDGQISIQSPHPPSEEIVELLHDAWKSYKKIVRRMN